MMYKQIKSLILLFVLITILACQDKSINDPGPAQLKGVYMGQSTPGNTLVRFLPNDSYISNSNWWWQGSPTFSPDGNEMYFVKYFTGSVVHEIWYSKSVNGIWSESKKAPFSTGSYSAKPAFLQSNDTLYYYSQNPDGFIYKVTRTSGGWSNPIVVEIPIPTGKRGYYFSITNNKTIYFTMMDNSSNNFMTNYATADIYRSRLVNGKYSQPENIGSSVNSNIGELIEYVDPNERFLLYSSAKTGGYGLNDIYISYKNTDGTWGTAANLGQKINTSADDGQVSITPDGKYFFLITQKSDSYGYMPYWIETKAIEIIK